MPSSPLVWFQLVDCATGQSYKGTSADYASLPPGSVIAQFRKAVKAECSSILTDIASSQLIVYKNKAAFDKRAAAVDEEKEEPLEEDSLIDGLGTSKKEALVVAVQASDASNLPYTSILEKLDQWRIPYTENALKYIANDAQMLKTLTSDRLTKREARGIVTSSQSKVNAAASQHLGWQHDHSVFLDGPLLNSQGQVKSSICYAFSSTAGVLVAKIYHGNEEDFMREVKVNQELDHKNIVKFIKNFSVAKEDGMKHVIIMPHFPRSVWDLLIPESSFPGKVVPIIARDCFDALCYMHSRGFCYADLKPSNIMLRSGEQGFATLVDFGATVRMGEPINEATKVYYLDADRSSATERFDWICLGTTVASILRLHLLNIDTVSDFTAEVDMNRFDASTTRFLKACMHGSDEDIDHALNEF